MHKVIKNIFSVICRFLSLFNKYWMLVQFYTALYWYDHSYWWSQIGDPTVLYQCSSEYMIPISESVYRGWRTSRETSKSNNAPNYIHRSKWTTILNVKLRIFSYPLILTYVLGAQKNRLIETVLPSTHNMCFGWEIRKIVSITLIGRACTIHSTRYYISVSSLGKKTSP